MHAMRALEKLEEESREEISKLLGVDEDDLPDDFDVVSIYHVDAAERLEALVCSTIASRDTCAFEICSS